MKCTRCEKEFLSEFLNYIQLLLLSAIYIQLLSNPLLNVECHYVGYVIPN